VRLDAGAAGLDRAFGLPLLPITRGGKQQDEEKER